MAETLGGVLEQLERRLGDESGAIWTRDELANYVREGYDSLCLQTGVLWEMDHLDDQATTANVTNEWEKAYLASGDLFTGVFAYTADFERDYVHESRSNDGPTNHNHIWERTNSYPSTFYYRAVHDLPADLHNIERATWDYKRIDPVTSRELESRDFRYELTNGEVIGYLRDKDGVMKFRKWKVPSAAADEYTVTGSWGSMRNPDDISTEEVIGSWGLPRRIPGEHPIRGPWGLPRRAYKSLRSVRIEFTRRGADMSVESHEFEIPDRYVKYIRHYAQGKALERNGPGQDMKLAGFYQGLFDAGIQRIRARMQALRANRLLELAGGMNRNSNQPPLARLPWQYGRYAGRVPL